MSLKMFFQPHGTRFKESVPTGHAWFPIGRLPAERTPDGHLVSVKGAQKAPDGNYTELVIPVVISKGKSARGREALKVHADGRADMLIEDVDLEKQGVDLIIEETHYGVPTTLRRGIIRAKEDSLSN